MYFRPDPLTVWQDDTLVRPKSGAKFPKSRADWTWLFAQVPEKLKKLHNEGYGVGIFTNQAGIGKGHVKASDIKGKILDLAKEVRGPLSSLFCSRCSSLLTPIFA